MARAENMLPTSPYRPASVAGEHATRQVPVYAQHLVLFGLFAGWMGIWLAVIWWIV